MKDKRTRLILTGVGSVVVDKEDKSDGIPRCNNGHSREFYQDLGLPEEKIPQEIKDKEKAQYNEELELEEVYSDIIVFYDQIKLIVEDDEGYTTIFLEDGLMVEVLETAIEIDNYMDYIQMNWFEKLKLSFLSFWRKIKWNLSKEKRQLEKQTENSLQD